MRSLARRGARAAACRGGGTGGGGDARSIDDERLVFNQGVKVHVGETLQGAREMGVVVKVYESFTGGLEVVHQRLRFEVYWPGTSAVESTELVGEVAVKEAVGAHHQHLLQPERQEAMLTHVCRDRLLLTPGLWDADADGWRQFGDRFTPRIIADRLFAMHKQTPLGAGGAGDADANRDKLVDEKAQRGAKILRQAQNIDGMLMHITAFELPSDHGEQMDSPPRATPTPCRRRARFARPPCRPSSTARPTRSCASRRKPTPGSSTPPIGRASTGRASTARPAVARPAPTPLPRAPTAAARGEERGRGEARRDRARRDGAAAPRAAELQQTRGLAPYASEAQALVEDTEREMREAGTTHARTDATCLASPSRRRRSASSATTRARATPRSSSCRAARSPRSSRAARTRCCSRRASASTSRAR